MSEESAHTNATFLNKLTHDFFFFLQNNNNIPLCVTLLYFISN